MTSRNTNDIQSLRTAILDVLQDNQFHSGEDLAAQFMLSRSAIANHIKALRELGLDIYSVKRKGYKLASVIELLSHAKICEYLPTQHKNKSSLVQVEHIVSSTNDKLKTIANLHTQATQKVASGYCCLAEAQTAGRGRRGKTWVSPFGSSLYFSMLWHFDEGYQAMAGLSLMIGVVVNRTLRELNINACKLKWPNDIYYNMQKLAGILIEIEGQAGGEVTAIIGIGININLPANVQGIDQAFTDLHSVVEQTGNSGNENNKQKKSEQVFGRNKLAASLIKNLWQAIPEFELHGLQAFKSEWEAADLYYDQAIKLICGDRTSEGISKGIDNNGALLVQTNAGIKTYHGGEISVRPA